MHAVVIVHPFVYNEFLTICNPSDGWCRRQAAEAADEHGMILNHI